MENKEIFLRKLIANYMSYDLIGVIEEVIKNGQSLED